MLLRKRVSRLLTAHPARAVMPTGSRESRRGCWLFELGVRTRSPVSSKPEQDSGGEKQHNQSNSRDKSDYPRVERRVKNDSHDK